MIYNSRLRNTSRSSRACECFRRLYRPHRRRRAVQCAAERERAPLIRADAALVTRKNHAASALQRVADGNSAAAARGGRRSTQP